MNEYYQHPQQTWNIAKCNKLANRTISDGLGTKYPGKGYLKNNEIGGHNGDLICRYNGGCEREGKWYSGEQFHLPIVPSDFQIVWITNWGWRIIRKV